MAGNRMQKAKKKHKSFAIFFLKFKLKTKLHKPTKYRTEQIVTRGEQFSVCEGLFLLSSNENSPVRTVNEAIFSPFA